MGSPVDSLGGKDCIGISRTRSAIGNRPADDAGEEGEERGTVARPNPA